MPKLPWIGLLGRQDSTNPYEYLNDAVSNRKLLYGENNPKYTTSLHNLAGLLSYIGRKKELYDLYIKSMNQYRNQIREYFPFLSEKEKTSFYAMIKERLDLFYCYALENYKDNPSFLTDMYDFQLSFKAELLKDVIKVRNNIKNSGNQDLLAKYDQWQKLKEELAVLYSFTSKELQAQGKDIKSIEAKANDLEKDLTKSSTAFNSEYIQVEKSWKDIQKVLAGDEAAMEIVRFSLFQNGWTNKIYYVGLLITKDTKNNPKLFVIDDNNILESKYIKNYNNSIRFKI